MNLLTRVLFLAAILVTTGCAVEKAIVEPPVQKGFITYRHDEGEQTPKFPFAYTWIKPDLESGRYSKIIIAPIDISLIDKKEWKKSIGLTLKNEEEFTKRMSKVADYFRKTLIKTFEASEKNRLTVSDTAAADTVRLEIALTEVIFGKPILYAGTFAIPLPATSYIFDSVDSPMMSCEGRIVDSTTGEVLVMFADRKLPEVKPFDLNKFTASSSLHEVADRWSDELFRSVNREGDTKVKKTPSFGIIPW